jgi:hypothetical protein
MSKTKTLRATPLNRLLAALPKDEYRRLSIATESSKQNTIDSFRDSSAVGRLSESEKL